MKLKLTVLPEKYAICRFSPHSAIPGWLAKADFFSVTRTSDELSVVAPQDVPESEDIPCSRDWRIIRIDGPLDLAIIGLMAEVAGIFRDAGIPIFTISTYDTDYILVKETDLSHSIHSLEQEGHTVVGLAL
jgi:hypothetical protein